MPGISTGVLVVMVDDRSTAEAAELRAGIAAAVEKFGEDFLLDSYFHWPDRATWHPVDLRVVLVPASSATIETVVSPATDPALAWTTNQATKEGRDALVRAVDSAVARMTAPLGASFRPLERAADVVRLLRGTRAASNDKEAALRDSTSYRRSGATGVSIIAATDDESPQDVASYRLDDPYWVTVTNVVTREGRGEEPPNVVRYPRLAAWEIGLSGGWGGCYDYDEAKKTAAPRTSQAQRHAARCTGRGDSVTVRIYREYIQLDKRRRQLLMRRDC